MTSAGRAREREREWTDSLLKFHSRICVCLSLKYWMKITLLHTHWCGGGKSANTYRDVRVVSLTLTEVCILLASQCCLEGVRSDCNHVWMFLACFLHISVLLALCKRNEASAQSHAPLLHATVSALVLFGVRRVVRIPHCCLLQEADALNNLWNKWVCSGMPMFIWERAGMF